MQKGESSETKQKLTEGNPSACWNKDVISVSRNSCVTSSGRLGLYTGGNSVYDYAVRILFVDIWHFTIGIGDTDLFAGFIFLNSSSNSDTRETQWDY